MKWLARQFYRFCDYLDRVICEWCEYETHQAKAFRRANTKRIKEIMDLLNARVRVSQQIAFYAGPYDGAQGVYAGLVYRLPLHSDGVYCFDGEIYRWTTDTVKNPVDKKE